MIKLTGLWKKTRADGYVYYTGQINDRIRVIVYPNGKKNSDNQPDFEVFLDDSAKPGLERGDAQLLGTRAHAPKTEPTSQEPTQEETKQ